MNALSSGRGGGGGFSDRRTTMSAIKDEGLGMSEKPDWIVVSHRSSIHMAETSSMAPSPLEACRRPLPSSQQSYRHCRHDPVCLSLSLCRSSPPRSTTSVRRTAMSTPRATATTTVGPARRSCRTVATGSGESQLRQRVVVDTALPARFWAWFALSPNHHSSRSCNPGTVRDAAGTSLSPFGGTWCRSRCVAEGGVSSSYRVPSDSPPNTRAG